MRIIASLLVLIFLSGCSTSAKEKFANSFSEFKSGVADTFTDEQRVQIENAKKEVDTKLLAVQQENENLSFALALEQEKVKKMEDDNKSCKKKKNKK